MVVRALTTAAIATLGLSLSACATAEAARSDAGNLLSAISPANVSDATLQKTAAVELNVAPDQITISNRIQSGDRVSFTATTAGGKKVVCRATIAFKTTQNVSCG